MGTLKRVHEVVGFEHIYTRTILNGFNRLHLCASTCTYVTIIKDEAMNLSGSQGTYEELGGQGIEV